MTFRINLNSLSTKECFQEASREELRVLLTLVSLGGEVVSEEMLLAAMGGDTTANVVQVHVYRLRKKLSAEKRFLLRTVRGKGYCLEGKIEI